MYNIALGDTVRIGNTYYYYLSRDDLINLIYIINL